MLQRVIVGTTEWKQIANYLSHSKHSISVNIIIIITTTPSLLYTFSPLYQSCFISTIEVTLIFFLKQWLFVSLCYFWLTSAKQFPAHHCVSQSPARKQTTWHISRGMVWVLEISCLQNHMMDWRTGSQKEHLCTPESKSTLSLMWIRGQDASTSFLCPFYFHHYEYHSHSWS